MNTATKNLINLLIKRHKFVMFEFSDGLVYWLEDYHRHLDPEDSNKVLLGKSEVPKLSGLRDSNRKRNSKIVYLTTTI